MRWLFGSGDLVLLHISGRFRVRGGTSFSLLHRTFFWPLFDATSGPCRRPLPRTRRTVLMQFASWGVGWLLSTFLDTGKCPHEIQSPSTYKFHDSCISRRKTDSSPSCFLRRLHKSTRIRLGHCTCPLHQKTVCYTQHCEHARVCYSPISAFWSVSS